MRNVIILVGVSGSGKSTHATEYMKNNPNYLRVNRDSIRKTLVGDLKDYYTRKDLNKIESIVNMVQDDMINTILHYGYDVIIDNTSLKQQYIKELLSEFTSNVTIQFKIFDCRLDIAKNRIIRRDFYKEYEDQITLDAGDIDLSKSPEVDYIDKQFEQYKIIKQWLLENHKDKILS